MIAEDNTSSPVEETDFLIVGAGPAGASLACFLSEYGLKGTMIASAPGTANTPRAHITNMAALECLRDIGLEEECLAESTKTNCMEHTRWCHSMAGEEYARIHSWGNDPHRMGEYSDASPCNHVDLPQTLAEPILVKRATEKGWDIRFSHKLTTFDDHGYGKGVTSTILNRTTDTTYQVHSRFVFACDGARSVIVDQLNIPLIKKPGGGIALNILVEADLSHLVESRVGNLHWIVQPDRPHPKWGQMCILRMVKAWTEWIFIVLPEPGWDPKVDGEPTDDEYMARCREFLGDDTIPVRLLGVSKWFINEIVAEHYSSPSQQIHCLGDAVHRHPPFNGLGSNTCIQDAYNLAWKIAYLMRGHAGPAILPSFSIERQPVGLGVVTRANNGFRDHVPVLTALGVMEPNLEESTRAFKELSSPTQGGATRRANLRSAIHGTRHEFHALGQEMNQHYTDSPAIFMSDESSPPPSPPEDPILTHQITTHPGFRLPHAWLNTRVPGPQISTQDLAGHGRFCMFIGPGDNPRQSWRAAVKDVNQRLGIDIRVVSIGWKCDYEDVYGDWAGRREVGDDGCVLVRPDRFVAWRSVGGIEERTGKIEEVMRGVLGLDADGRRNE